MAPIRVILASRDPALTDLRLGDREPGSRHANPWGIQRFMMVTERQILWATKEIREGPRLVHHFSSPENFLLPGGSVMPPAILARVAAVIPKCEAKATIIRKCAVDHLGNYQP